MSLNEENTFQMRTVVPRTSKYKIFISSHKTISLKISNLCYTSSVDEDIDGVPLESETQDTNERGLMGGFIPSRWETVETGEGGDQSPPSQRETPAEDEIKAPLTPANTAET